MTLFPQIFPDLARAVAVPVLYTGAGNGTEAQSLAPAIQEIQVSLPRHGAGSARLVLGLMRDERGRVPVIDGGAFDRMTRIRLALAFGAAEVDLMVGYVLKAEAEFAEERAASRLVVELQDETALLARTARPRSWPDAPPEEQRPQSDRSILAAILAAYPGGLSVDPATPEAPNDAAPVQTEDDFAFLMSRAERRGAELRLRLGRAYLGPPRPDRDPQPVVQIQAGPATTCTRFSVSEDGDAPDEALAQVPPPALESAPAEGAPPPATPAPLRLTPQIARLGDRGVPRPAGAEPRVLRIDGSREPSAAAVRAMAQGQLDAATLSIRATAEVNGTLYGHVIEPGRALEIDGAGARHDGLWYVDAVEHTLTAAGYRQVLALLRNGVGAGGPGAALAEDLL